MKSARSPLLTISHGISDFFRDGSRAFSLIMLWMNAFCAVYIWSYYQTVLLTIGHPPREMTAGVVLIVMSYIIGDTRANIAYLQAFGGGMEAVPAPVPAEEVPANEPTPTPQTPANSGD